MRSSVCIGRMAHVRHTPRAHRFGYAVDMTLLDLDEIDTVFDGRWFWSTRRPRGHVGGATITSGPSIAR